MEEQVTVNTANRAEWRAWLEENHDKFRGVWLVYYKKSSGKPSVSYDEAVEEAIAFGWIDSTVRAVDSDRYMQYFSPRNKGSHWSKTNKERVERLIAQGRMTPAGLQKIESAKKDGSWAILDDVEELRVPPDLEDALRSSPPAAEHWAALNDSLKKQMLYWVISAKRPATRQSRLDKVVEAAKLNKMPFA